jgi:hypothetical protein
MTSDRETPLDDTTFDADEAIHNAENRDEPARIPPDSEEDFEKAVRGDNRTPEGIHIPTGNAD